MTIKAVERSYQYHKGKFCSCSSRNIRIIQKTGGKTIEEYQENLGNRDKETQVQHY